MIADKVFSLTKNEVLRAEYFVLLALVFILAVSVEPCEPDVPFNFKTIEQ